MDLPQYRYLKKPFIKLFSFALSYFWLVTLSNLVWSQDAPIDYFEDVTSAYNAFILEEFESTSSEIQGRLAAGGDITLNSYSVASSISTPPETPTLIAGGDLVYGQGKIFTGSGLAAGSIAGVNQSVIYGLENGAAITGNASIGIDFSFYFSKLAQLSNSLSQAEPTGTTVYQWGGIYLTGDCQSQIQVFNLSGTTVLNSNHLNMSCVPSDATIIFNIDGAVAGFKNIGLSQLQNQADKVLYNFHQANSIEITWVGIQGTILAPHAHMNNPRGEIYGTAIAKSWDGSMSLRNVPFTGSLQSIVGVPNQAPIALDQTIDTSEDTSVSLTLAATDQEGDPLTYSLASSPVNGALSGDLPNLVYTPSTNYNGSDSFTFKVNDGELDSNIASVTIDVLSQNDAPVAENISLQTDEDVAVDVALTAVDVEGDSLNYFVISQPLQGTLTGVVPNLVYSPNANASGTDSFTYKANDGELDSDVATVTLEINAVNDIPVADAQSLAIDEDIALAVTLTGSDVEGDSLTFTLVNSPSLGVLSGTAPNLIYTPNANANGLDSFSFVVNDGQIDSAEATIEITIESINDAPIAEDIALQTNEDVSIAVTLLDSDIENDPLTYEIVNAPLSGSLTGAAPNLTYVPDANANGPDSFSYRVNDGQLNSSEATVSIDILAVNDAPEGIEATYSLDEDSGISIALLGSDIDSATLSYSVISQPVNGSLTGTAPNLTYTPNANFFGSDSLQFTVNDGELDSVPTDVLFSVNPINDAPVITSLPVLDINPDADYEYQVIAEDIDDITLTYNLSSAPAGMSIDGNGLIIWEATDFIDGIYSVEIVVSDTEGAQAFQSFELELVLEIPPQIFSDPLTSVVAADEYNYQVVAEDPSGEALTYSLLSAPDDMTIDETTGQILWQTDLDDVNSSVTGSTEPTEFCGEPECELFFFDPIESGSDATGIINQTEDWDQSWNVISNYAIGDESQGRITIGHAGWANYSFEVGLLYYNRRFTSPLITFLEQENGDHMAMNVGSSFATLYRSINGQLFAIRSFANPLPRAFDEYSFRIEVMGNSAKIYMNDILMFNESNLLWSSGKIGLDPLLERVNVTSIRVYQTQPDVISINPNEVQVQVTNESGSSVIQSFSLSVIDQNSPPSIGGIPTEHAYVGEEYRYDVKPFDPNFADTLLLSLQQGPIGMVIEGNELVWTPDTLGSYDISVTATDSQGLSRSQDYSLQVYALDEQLQITSTPITQIEENQSYSYQLASQGSSDLTLRYQLDRGYKNPKIAMTIDPVTGLVNGVPNDDYLESAEAINLSCRGFDSQGDFFDVSNWSPIIYDGVHASLGSWQKNGTTATMVTNGDPSILLSGVFIESGVVEVTLQTFSGDDDFIGFVWGYQNPNQFYRMRWGDNEAKFQSVHVINTPDGLERLDGNHPTDIELYRGITGTGWDQSVEYRIILDINPGFTTIQTYQGEQLIQEYEVFDATYSQGGFFGFYNHSQQNTVYKARLLTTTELADLRVGNIELVNSNLQETVSVNISNRGAAVSEATTVKLYERRSSEAGYLKLLDTQSIPALTVGETVDVGFESFPEGISYNEIYVVVDEEDTVEECEEANNQILSPIVQVRVSEPFVQFDYQRFAISLKNVNDSPVVISSPVTDAVAGETYTYVVVSSDQDIGDKVSYELTESPEGMVIDSDSGRVGWIPPLSVAGDQEIVTVRASDLEGGFVDHSFVINVQSNPTILSEPETLGRVNELYQYQIIASDVDGDSLNYTLTNHPTSMTVDASGLISWTPDATQIGTNNVEVLVYDGKGGEVRQSYSIFVFSEGEFNSPPEIISAPILQAEALVTYSYVVQVTDDDNDALTFSLPQAPSGMSIDDIGVITWLPSENDIGLHTVQILVTDGRGGVDTQSYILSVKAAGSNQPPSIDSSPAIAALIDELYTYQVEATDPDGDTLVYATETAPAGMSINANDGQLNWLPTVSGTYEVSVSASDGLVKAIQMFTLEVYETSSPPELIGEPPKDAYVGVEYLYEPRARDFTGASADVAFVSGPDGMTYDELTGQISWIPPGDQCVIPLTLLITDQFGQSVEVSFDISVHAALKKLNRFQCSLDDASCGL